MDDFSGIDIDDLLKLRFTPSEENQLNKSLMNDERLNLIQNANENAQNQILSYSPNRTTSLDCQDSTNELVAPPSSVTSSIETSDTFVTEMSSDEQAGSTASTRSSVRKRPQKNSPEWEELREKNRLAARKHVQKKKQQEEATQKKLNDLKAQNNELVENICQVESQIRLLHKILHNIIVQKTE